MTLKEKFKIGWKNLFSFEITTKTIYDHDFKFDSRFNNMVSEIITSEDMLTKDNIQKVIEKIKIKCTTIKQEKVEGKMVEKGYDKEGNELYSEVIKEKTRRYIGFGQRW